MSTKKWLTLISLLVVISMVLAACGSGASVASPVPTDLVTLQAVNFGQIRVSASQVSGMNINTLMFVPNTAAIPASAIRVYSASSLAENGFLIGASQTLTAVGAATLISSLALGNTVQNTSEGQNLILQVNNGDGTYGYWEVQSNGQIIVREQSYLIQAVPADASAVQESAEGKVDVNARSQCAETSQGCQPTPGPQKYAAVFGDANDSSIVATLNLWGFQGTLFQDNVSLVASTMNYDLVVVRAGQPDGWRINFIPVIKQRWPNAVVIVMSGGNYRQKAMDSGANDYFSDGSQSPVEMETMIRKFGLIP